MLPWIGLLFTGLACTADPVADSGDTGDEPGLADNFGVQETAGQDTCENLLDSHCMLPFPSDFFREEAVHEAWLDFGEAMPDKRSGGKMSDGFFHGVDGYGVASPILIQWPGATLTGLPEVFQPEQSLLADAGTIVLDADTGQLLGHWAETDYMTADQQDPVIILRPAVTLPPGHRIVVGIRGLHDADGQLLPAPEGFAALRDQAASTVVGMHARRDRFEAEVFTPLQEAGWARDELQLAWDFTVASEEDGTTDLLTVRDRLLDAIGDDGPEYVIDSVQESVDGSIGVMATGRVFVPNFLEEPDGNGLQILRRDDSGLPVAEGTHEWEFTLQIPWSVLEGEELAGVMQYGHGFNGSKSEANNGWLRELADSSGFLILATNLQGNDESASGVWTLGLAEDPGWFPWFSEPSMQGIANQLALQRMMKGRFLVEADARLSRDGEPLYDPDRIWYYGNSQGGTMGTLMMALSTDVTRGGLGVPGCAYPFLLHRSTVFTELSLVITGLFDTSTDGALLLALLGTGFNRIEGLVFAPHLGSDPLPNTPAHQVLLHVAKGDSQVQNQDSFLLGRGAGAVVPTPAVESIWGLDEVSYPSSADAVLVEYDFGVPEDDTPMDPPDEDTDTHGWLRKLDQGQEQLMHFLETGEVIDTCGGDGCYFDGEP